MFRQMICAAIEYTQHLIEQKTAQEKKLDELRKEVMALKIMKQYVMSQRVFAVKKQERTS